MERKKKDETDEVKQEEVVKTTEDEPEVPVTLPEPELVTREPEVDGITCSVKEIKFKEDTVTIVFSTSDSTQFVPFVVLCGNPLVLNVCEAQGKFRFAETKDEPDAPGTGELDFDRQQCIANIREGLIAEIRELETNLEVAEPHEFIGDEDINDLVKARDILRDCAAPPDAPGAGA